MAQTDRWRVIFDGEHVTLARASQTALYRLNECVSEKLGEYTVVDDRRLGVEQIRERVYADASGKQYTGTIKRVRLEAQKGY